MKDLKELLEYMQTLIDENVKCYKSDFDVDKTALTDIVDGRRAAHGYKMIWGYRESGTDIGFISDFNCKNSWINAVVDQIENKWYEVDLKHYTLTPIKDIYKYRADMKEEAAAIRWDDLKEAIKNGMFADADYIAKAFYTDKKPFTVYTEEEAMKYNNLFFNVKKHCSFDGLQWSISA